MPLRVKDWDSTFALKEVERHSSVKWTRFPVARSSAAYRYLMQSPEGRTAYCVFVVCIQLIASNKSRGVLKDDSAETIHFASGIPIKEVEESLRILASERIGWVSLTDQRSSNGASTENKRSPTVSQTVAFVCSPLVLSDSSGRKSAEKETKLELPSSLETPECRAAIAEWLEYKRERGERYKPRGMAALMKKLEGLGPQRAIAAIQHSMASNYAGPFEPKGASNGSANGWRDRKVAGEFKENLQVPIVYGGSGKTGTVATGSPLRIAGQVP